MLLLALLEGLARAHSGAAPVRGVYDWSKLPDAEPGAWLVWDLYPSIVLGCLAFAVGYELMAGPLRTRWRLSDEGPSPGQRLAFHGGLFVVFASLQGPLHELSDVYLFSGHMVQHLLITLVFPPLALAGIPAWMWDPLLAKGWALRVGKVLGHPAAGFLVSTAVLYLWHVPAMYEWALRDHGVHVVEHLSFMAAYVILWWPALSRHPALPPLTPGYRMVYLFLLTIPMKALGAVITVSDWILYPFYAVQPRVFGLDPLYDQRLGGLIMWLPGGLVFWVTIGVTFFLHYSRDVEHARRPRLTVVEGGAEVGVIVLLTLFACGGAPSPDPAASQRADGTVWTGTTQTGRYALAVRFDPPSPPIGELFAVEATLTDREGAPIDDALVALDARMPQHGHGMMTDPVDLPGTCEDDVCTHPDGVYRTEGFKFHMGGDWTVTLEVQGPRGRDTTSFVHPMR